jgi:hypothetical protein
MSHHEVRLHVAEPRINPGKVSHLLVHDVLVLLVDQVDSSAALFRRVHAYPFLPLITTVV